jgi:hypothetical protein
VLLLLAFSWVVHPAVVPQDSTTIEVENDKPAQNVFPVEGKEGWVRIKNLPAGSQVKIIYRPESEVKEEVPVAPDGDGEFRWTPKYAGLAEIRIFELVPDSRNPKLSKEKTVTKKTVSVAFASSITLGVFIMAAAGLILFGGAFVSIRALLRAPPGPDGTS